MFSGSGTITGTNSVDFVSAVSTSQAGDFLKFEFDMGEDNVTDMLSYVNGWGKEHVKIYNFRDKPVDDLKSKFGNC